MGKRRVQKSFGNFGFSSIKFRSRTEFFGFIRKRRGGNERENDELTNSIFPVSMLGPILSTKKLSQWIDLRMPWKIAIGMKQRDKSDGSACLFNGS